LTLSRSLGGRGVRAHGEDRFSSDGGADRARQAPRGATVGARGVGTRRAGTGGAQTAAAQRLASLYPTLELDLDLDVGDADSGVDRGTAAPAVAAGPGVVGPGPLPIVASQAAVLWDGLAAAYDALGFEQACGRDAVFRLLMLARIIEPTSKQDSLRVLPEVGVDSVPSYATLKRRLKAWTGSAESWPRRARGTRRWGQRRWCSTT
jgi:hypothetical protein